MAPWGELVNAFVDAVDADEPLEEAGGGTVGGAAGMGPQMGWAYHEGVALAPCARRSTSLGMMHALV